MNDELKVKGYETTTRKRNIGRSMDANFKQLFYRNSMNYTKESVNEHNKTFK